VPAEPRAEKTPVKETSARLRADAEGLAARFPSLLVDARRIAQTVAAGAHGRRRAGVGETFWQHRPYAEGDPVAGIDWRQSARTADRLYVRENEWETAATVWIWRDRSASLDYTSSRRLETKARRADLAALALAILLAQSGERVGLVGSGAPPVSGRGAAERFLERLAETARAGDDASLPPPPELKKGAQVVLVSDFYVDLDDLARRLRAYAGAGTNGLLVQIVDPAEEDFPFKGRTEFLCTETEGRRLFGDAGAVRADYRARFAAHRDALGEVARRQGWTMLSHRTDASATSLLLALHQALAGSRR